MSRYAVTDEPLLSNLRRVGIARYMFRKAIRFIPPLVALVATSMASSHPAPRHSFRDGMAYPVMEPIPAGEATLGSNEAETTREGRTPAFAAYEHPQRKVRFVRPFAMGMTHVTRREFATFVGATKRNVDGCVVTVDGKWSEGPLAGYSFVHPGFFQRDDEPAVCISWDDASAYTAWLSQRTGKHYRLPSEDEWEYAVRGGNSTARWWGDDASDICKRVNGGDQSFAKMMPSDKSANTSCSDGYTYTNPVMRFPANPFGLRDTYGNAWQWAADCFVAVAGTAQPSPCKARTIRGGSWHNSVSTLRSATRFSLPPAMRSSSLGFRIMREM